MDPSELTVVNKCGWTRSPDHGTRLEDDGCLGPVLEVQLLTVSVETSWSVSFVSFVGSVVSLARPSGA